jgi:hypothetical protein
LQISHPSTALEFNKGTNVDILVQILKFNCRSYWSFTIIYHWCENVP